LRVAREYWIQFELTLTNGKIVVVGAGVKGTVIVAADPSSPGLPIPATRLIGRAGDLEVAVIHLTVDPPK